MKKLLLRCFRSPAFHKYTLIVSLLLMVPSLFIGYLTDDYFIMSNFQNNDFKPVFETDNSLFQLFSASDGTAEAKNHMVDNGILPWWTHNDFRFKMFRPMAEVTHWLDATLWPSSQFMMHLQNLFWWAALLCVVLSFYRKYFSHSPVMLSITFFIFAFDPNVAETLIWIAARNTLMSVVFGLLALKFYENSRTSGGMAALALSSICFAMGIASSELGLSAGAFILSYAIFMDKGAYLQRALSLIPYALIFFVWVYIYADGEHGAAASSKYVSPMSDPGLFVDLLAERVPAMLFQDMFKLPIHLIMGKTSVLAKSWIVAVLSLLVLAFVARAFIRSRIASYLMFGGLLSVLPIASTGDARVMIFVNFGLAPIMGYVLSQFLFVDLKASNWKVKLGRVGLGLIFSIHCLMIPLIPGAAVLGKFNLDASMVQPALTLPIEDEGETLIVINPYISSLTSFFPAIRALEPKILPARMYSLVSGINPVQLTRVSETEIQLSSDKGLFAGKAELFTRPFQSSLFVGDTFEYEDLSVRVEALNDESLPSTITARFPLDVIKARGNWVICEGDEWKKIKLPIVGDTVELQKCTMSFIGG